MLRIICSAYTIFTAVMAAFQQPGQRKMLLESHLKEPEEDRQLLFFCLGCPICPVAVFLNASTSVDDWVHESR